MTVEHQHGARNDDGYGPHFNTVGVCECLCGQCTTDLHSEADCICPFGRACGEH